jgi:GGDEF domain-containing protein
MDKIEELERIITKLSTDPSFGILTRNALDLAIEKAGKPFNVIFIDFNNVHSMNKIIGYGKVNSSIRFIFNTYREIYKNDIIGRWFSGDEIAIVFWEGFASQKIKMLEEISNSNQMSFKSMYFMDQYKNLDEIIY